MTVGAASSPPRRRRPSRCHQVSIELSARQVELVLLFADDRGVGSVRVQTCDALVSRGLIRQDEGSRGYWITELGQAVAAVVGRQT